MKMRTNKYKNRKSLNWLILLLLLFGLFFYPSNNNVDSSKVEKGSVKTVEDISDLSDIENSAFDLNQIPDYTKSSKPFVQVGNGKAHFSNKDIERLSCPGYEYYAALDSLGRCGYAEACVGKETMPEYGEERGNISSVHPSGWHSNCDYERCHLIAFCLTGENANDHNLVTGTGYMNREGMLPFELKIARYVDNTGNHVMYRVTPIFKDSEAMCRGVHLEAKSIENKDINFDVYCYNVDPEHTIDYSSGYWH